MIEATVRISEIILEGFKNIEYGRIEMPSADNKNLFSKKADILGIYGQNGSGKTAVIEAMEFAQILLTGQPLPREAIHYVSKGGESCTITIKFMVHTDGKTTMVEYSVQLKKTQEYELEIVRETLNAAIWNGNKFESKKTLIDYSLYSQGPIFTPKYRFEDLIRNDDENKVNLGVAK